MYIYMSSTSAKNVFIQFFLEEFHRSLQRFVVVLSGCFQTTGRLINSSPPDFREIGSLNKYFRNGYDK